jgi:branched-chain amino acid transport system permease protein
MPHRPLFAFGHAKRADGAGTFTLRPLLSGQLDHRLMALRAIMGWVVVSLAAWAVLARVLPKGLPPGIVVLGLIYGALYAVVAFGIVLVYRANRIINFAQAQTGVLAAILAIELVVTYHVPYLVGILAGIVTALVIGAITSLLPRRFRKSSRLILTVATIGLAQLLSGLATIVPLWFCNPSNNPSCTTNTANQTFTTPVHGQFSVYPVIFTGNDIVALGGAAVIAVALTLFLHRSRYGVAIRAAADNSDRAMLLGIPVPRLDTVVWSIAALLSALAILLRVPVLGFGGFQTVSGGGDDILLRTLAAAVIGRMESLPRTAAAALAIGVFDSAATWTFSNTTYVDAILVLVIVVALLLQKGKYTRLSESESSSWRAVAAVRPIPRELAKLREVRWSMIGIKVAVVAVAVLLPLVLAGSQIYLVSLIVIYAIVGLSLLVLTGWSGQISLGQFALAGLGGATTAVLYGRHGWNFIPALIAGIVVGALAALVIGLPALRMRGPYLAVTTLAFGICASSYLLAPNYLTWFVTPQITRPTLFGHDVLGQDWQLYYFCLIGFVLAMLAVRSLRKSRTGRSLIATRDNEPAAMAVTLDTTRQKLLAFLVSGAIAGFAGALFVVQQEGVNNGSFTADINIALFSMVVIGGLGSMPGVVIGAAYVWSTQYFLPAGWSVIASGGGILFLLIFLPEGLGGLLYDVRDRLLRLLAAHKHLTVGGLAPRGEAAPSGDGRPPSPRPSVAATIAADVTDMQTAAAEMASEPSVSSSTSPTRGDRL